MTVTFFGHRDCSEAIRPQLQRVLEDLIAEGADCFYAGSQGRFDRMVISLFAMLIRFDFYINIELKDEDKTDSVSQIHKVLRKALNWI